MYPVKVILIVLLLLSTAFASNRNKREGASSDARKVKISRYAPDEAVAPNVPTAQNSLTFSDDVSKFNSSSQTAVGVDPNSTFNLEYDLFGADIELNLKTVTKESVQISQVFDDQSTQVTKIPIIVTLAFDFPNVVISDVPESFEWNIQDESKLSFNFIEYQQFKAVTFFPIFNELATKSKTKKINRFEFSRNWPDIPETVPPSELFCRFQMLAFESVFTPGRLNFLKKMIDDNLVDLSRPVYESQNQIYRSFLSLVMEKESVDVEKLDALLQFCPKNILSKANSKGITPLEVAIRKNRLDLVQKLIEAGAEIDSNSFMHAVKQRNLPIIDYLLIICRVDPNIIIGNGTVNIEVTIENLGIEYVRRILNIFNEKYIIDIRTFGILLVDLHLKNSPVLRILAKIAVSPYMNNNVRIPLVLLMRNAVIKNDLELTRYLHSLGVPITTNYPRKNALGMKLIHYAASYGHIEMVNLLFELGENMDCISRSGLSVLEVAVIKERYCLAAELIKKGAKIGLAECIQIAILKNYVPMIEALLFTSENLSNFILPNEHNLITFAIVTDRPEILNILLSSQRISTSECDKLGQSINNLFILGHASEELKIL